jgi:hypothetical protein
MRIRAAAVKLTLSCPTRLVLVACVWIRSLVAQVHAWVDQQKLCHGAAALCRR